MNESANYAKISLLKKERKISGLTKTQSESFVSCCREKGANKRHKNLQKEGEFQGGQKKR